MDRRPVIAGLIAGWILLGAGGCAQWKSPSGDGAGAIPPAPREFRAAWVASVSNINWPSKPGLTTEQQQQEAIAILDLLQKLHFNAVIFQVRPQCDALYASELEPWSYFLTGQQGKAPEPFYDPLEFWIEQAHDRGLELHAWFNPYRAQVGKARLADNSVVALRPELVKQLKNGTWWMDPALKATQDHSCAVVLDVVRRYDVDGIHFDDYFYPYPSYNNDEDFPDEDSWQAYVKRGGKLARNDWRRQAVNQFIQRIYRGIKKEKPVVKFGLSPFGIWRPGYPESISGFDQYGVLYADARLWLNKGWVDYWTPQLYWPIGKIPQSFPVLVNWWSQENRHQRHFWPGINIGKGVEECINQIMVTRGMLPQSPGVVHWSVDGVRKNDELAQALLEGPYARAALVPASPWLDRRPPAQPQVTANKQGSQWVIQFSHRHEEDVFRWMAYIKEGKRWRCEILNRKERSLTLPQGKAEQVAIAAVDRTGNESGRTAVMLAD